jgi:hypothetical protein
MVLDPKKGTGMLSHFLGKRNMPYCCMLPHLVAVTLVAWK